MLFSNTFVWNENLIRSSNTSGEGTWKSLEKHNKSFAGADTLAQDLKRIMWVKFSPGGTYARNVAKFEMHNEWYWDFYILNID